MKYLSGKSILDLAQQLGISRKDASRFMGSTYYRTAIEYCGAWGSFFREKLSTDVAVTYGHDLNWHVKYKEPK